MPPKSKKKNPSEPPPIPPLVFIDGSFFCFYRAGATSVWFSRHTSKGEIEDCHIENEEFRNYYRTQFLNTLHKLLKKIKVPIPKGTPLEDLPNLPQVFWFRDTAQDKIWRKQHLPNYKGSRADPVITDTDLDSSTPTPPPKSQLQQSIGQIIKWSYQNIIPPNKTIRIPTCEADDGIAVATRHEQQTNPTQPIYIISGDSDLLQLCNHNTIQINPKSNPQFKPSIIEFKISSSNKPILSPELYLLTKIIAGDKTDDIPTIYSGCGPATALNLAQNPTLFNQQILNHPDSQRHQNYLLNRLLIDLTQIPSPLQQLLLTQYLQSKTPPPPPPPPATTPQKPKLILKFKI